MAETTWSRSADKYDKFVQITQHFSKLALNLMIERIKKENNFNEEEVKMRDFEVLDIACGTGSFSHIAAKELPNAKIISADYSPQMITILNEKSKLLNYEKQITSYVCDGQDLQVVRENTIDIAASIFGLIFFNDRKKGWREINRVLKKGGYAVVATWVKTESLSLYEEAIFEIEGKLPTKTAQDVVSLADPLLSINEIQSSFPSHHDGDDDDGDDDHHHNSFQSIDVINEVYHYCASLDEVYDFFVLMNDNPVIKEFELKDDKMILKRIREKLESRVDPNTNLCSVEFNANLFLLKK